MVFSSLIENVSYATASKEIIICPSFVNTQTPDITLMIKDKPTFIRKIFISCHKPQ
jgi:hypothetical protein